LARKLFSLFALFTLVLSVRQISAADLITVPAIDGSGSVIQLKTLTQDGAEAIVAAAKKAALEMESPIYKPAKTKMHIHVLGREGTLMASSQTQGAWPGSDDIAGKKAKTSWLFKLPTRTIGELSRPEMAAKGPLYAIEISNGGLITFPGGLPLFSDDGQLVGSIGVSGDTVDADEAVAKAGVEALKKLPNAIIAAPSLTQSAAEVIVAAAKAKALTLESPIYKPAKTKMHVHVIGLEGTLLAATQADNAWPGSDDIATKKAKTALSFKLPTRVIGELSRSELKDKGPLYGIELSNGGLISFPGGLPLMDDKGNCVGAIGVSGDTVDMDEEVAKAGVEAFKKLFK
jgi:uncharacterized protein GlcG (DUF336 family)